MMAFNKSPIRTSVAMNEHIGISTSYRKYW